ncbi:hypothetical protein FIBSPDRAFT_34510 [Athelia psychrophila]|uniref:Uncharacterized protein n=1 Tax=Athelia psychrophila TaxID=1759441 RepID=A0A166FV60_9AGAM|nr:hypothetical protein FIBSPDRAFT_34510 [Fibularhizoctonia sp. CBS 109695]
MGYFVFQSIAGQLMLTAIHLILMSRVRMLFAKRRYIVDTLFVFLILAETAVILRICIVTFPHFQLGPHCAAHIPAVDDISYGVITVVLQSAIICLTLLKYFQTTQHFRHHIAILSHLVRDGTCAFVVIITCQIMTVVYALPRYGSAGFTLIQSWLVTLLSCVGCRLIVNLHELGRGGVLDTESMTLGVITTTPELLYVVN